MQGVHGAMTAATAAIGVLTVMDGIVKHVSTELATLQIVFLRYVSGAVCAAIVFRIAGTVRPSIAAVRAHAVRSLVVALTATSFFYALATLQFAVAMALGFTAPIFIALFAAMTLGERPGRAIWLAIAIGFAGVLVVLSGELAEAGRTTWLGVAAALFSALSYGIVMVMLKNRAALDPVPTIVLLQNVMAGLFMTPAGLWAWSPLSLTAAFWLALIGVLGTVGHLAMAWAYGRAEASRLGVLEYTAFVWAALIGLVFFAEIPSLSTVAGACLIIAGALLVAPRRLKARAASPQP
jgi:drug/metabolite transporter (DMT)-like permease